MHLPTANAAQSRRGFTLVEMIGVLAIVATLAAMLVPQVLGIISRSRVLDAVGAYNSIKAGAITYAAKYGLIGDINGRALDVDVDTDVATNWDRDVLLRLNLIDERFRTKVAAAVSVQVRESLPADTAPDGSNAAYNLLGLDGTPNLTAGVKHVLDVHLTDVLLDDARELNRHIDGTFNALGETSEGTDLRGRVKYDFSSSPTPGMGDVYLYLTHL